MENYVSIAEASRFIGVTQKTLRVWDKEGILTPYRTPKGHRRYLLSDIETIVLGRCRPKAVTHNNVLIYASVSTKKQMESGDLAKQIMRMTDYCTANGYNVLETYSEVASGLNDKRQQLLNMLSSTDHIQIIIVECPDRLARFGLNYIIAMLKQINIEVEFLESSKDKSLDMEMTEDIISIITCFSARLFGIRGGRKIKKVLKELEVEETPDEIGRKDCV